jgi:hypothetical protein
MKLPNIEPVNDGIPYAVFEKPVAGDNPSFETDYSDIGRLLYLYR